MVNEIVLAIDPALRKIEDVLLWKNKLKTCGIFTVCHFLFWLSQNFNIRTYCIFSCVALAFHILDAYRTKKRREIIRIQQAKPNIIENVSSLGRYILFINEKLAVLCTNLMNIKKRNRLQYFLALFIFWSMLAVVGIKIRGVYLAYLAFWIVFFIPPFLHYDVPRKMLCKALPLLEQLDHSMKYKRRSVLDKNELLVDVRIPDNNDIDEEMENEYLQSFRLADLSKMSARERRVFEKLQDDEDDDEEDEIDENDVAEEDEEEIDRISTNDNEDHDDYNVDHSQQSRVNYDANVDRRIRTQKSSSKSMQLHEASTDDEDGLNSFLPDKPLPNVSDVMGDYFPKGYDSSQPQRVLRKRPAKTRPSLLDYYSNPVPSTENNRTKTYTTSTSRQNENDIDETFDFLDEYNKEDDQ